MADIGGLRSDYDTPGLEPEHLGDDPIEQLRRWLEEAIAAGVSQANAVSLATSSGDDKVSVRTVLLKEIDSGLVIYTNYESPKARDMEATRFAAMSLTWVDMHRQVRARGSVERVSEEQSDAYFSGRPRGAQIAALASRQSTVLPDRSELERRFAEVDASHPGPVPRPAHWGGYRLVPEQIEFWQGRRNRTHDRIEYLRRTNGWEKRRLSP